MRRWPSPQPDCPNCENGHMQHQVDRGEAVQSHCPECRYTERWDDIPIPHYLID